MLLFRQSLSHVFTVEESYECLELDPENPSLFSVLDEVTLDVVLVDLNLPEQLAIRVIKHVRDHDPHVKVVVIVSSICHSEVAECVAAGANGWVHEESSLDDLRSAIDDVRNGKPFYSRELVQSLFQHLTLFADQPHRFRLGGTRNLTPREQEVLMLISEGMSNKQIASRLHVSLYTVKNHVHNLLEKLDAQSRYEAIQKAQIRSL
jgi:DNA-binding NarL/FixJ family response regulator